MRIDFIFRIWPYVALALLVVGLAVRYALSRRSGSLSADLPEARQLFGGGRLWRLSLFFLLLAHLTGLLAPRLILMWNGGASRLYLLEGAGFLMGLVALGGWMGVLWRHLTGPRGQARGSLAADLGDSIFLAVLLIGLGTGLFTAALYRWASSWGAVTLTPYVTSLLRGDPMSALAAQMPFLVQLHVFSAFALLAALPFTRVAVFFIAAIEGAAGLLGRPIAAANRGAEGWLRKHNPAVWIWPEED